MKLLRNFVSLALLLVAILFLARHQMEAGSANDAANVINFYNWGDYIDPALIDEFESETGYRVIYETFDSNEAMMTKVQQGGTNYDVIVPSEYMVEAMKENDLLLPLDHSKLPNLAQIDPQFLDLTYDPQNQYSVPYFWGTLGIIYNTSMIEEGSIRDWADLWNPAYQGKILMIDGAREMIGIGLQSLGYSLNDIDSSHIRAAADKMKTLMPNVVGLITDEIKMHIAEGEVPLAVTFSGEAATAMDQNEDLAYVVPEKGSNLWLDTFAIPKIADNVEGAYALINFLTSKEASIANAEYVGYATPNMEAKAALPKEITDDKAFYPDQAIMDKLEVYRNLGQAKLIEYNDRFLEVKIEPKS